MAEQRVQRRLAAILAADVVGYSRMMREDESGTLAQLKTHRKEVFDPRVAEYNGRIVKTTGDGVLVEFTSAVDATECAIKVQRALARRNEDVPEGHRIELRIGINLGDIIVDGDDIYGDGVNVAARLEGLCDPGEVYASAAVFDQIEGKIEAAFDDLGEHTVKNIDKPISVFRVSSKPRPTTSTTGDTDKLFERPAVAVLPFENIGSDPEQEYFADGLTEDIITALSLLRSFPVIARNSSFAYKGQSPDIRKVGQELGARYVVEGSVRKGGDQVRATAQLIDATSGHHVWAERYDRAIDNFFDLQDEIADRIAAIIEPTLVKAEGKRIAAKRPSDLAAWEFCLKGFDHLAQYSKEDNALAREMFAAALALDPNYARAYSGIAYSHCRDFRFGSTDDLEESLRGAFDAARRAIALDETDSQAHIMLARAYSCAGDGDSAIAEGRRALEVNPHDTDALVMTGALMGFWGEPEEGIGLLESGLELNPLDPRGFNFMAHLIPASIERDSFGGFPSG